MNDKAVSAQESSGFQNVVPVFNSCALVVEKKDIFFCSHGPFDLNDVRCNSRKSAIFNFKMNKLVYLKLAHKYR